MPSNVWTAGACAVVLAAASISQPATAGPIRIDGSTAYSTPPLCTLGDMSCATFHTLGYSLALPDGTTTNRLYIYREGIIGLGSPVAGSVAGTPVVTSHGYYVAPAFGLVDLDAVLSINMNFPGAFVVNWMTGDAATRPDPAFFVYGQGGIFQVTFTNGDAPTSPGAPGPFPGVVKVDFNAPSSGSPSFNPLAPGFSSPRLTDGRPANALICGAGGYEKFAGGTSAACRGPTGVLPEAGTWALMLLGFASLGAALRRRRPVLPA